MVKYYCYVCAHDFKHNFESHCQLLSQSMRLHLLRHGLLDHILKNRDSGILNLYSFGLHEL